MAERKPRPTIRKENERALLEAAETIFAEQGFAGATTAAIPRRGRATTTGECGGPSARAAGGVRSAVSRQNTITVSPTLSVSK